MSEERCHASQLQHLKNHAFRAFVSSLAGVDALLRSRAPPGGAKKSVNLTSTIYTNSRTKYFAAAPMYNSLGQHGIVR